MQNLVCACASKGAVQCEVQSIQRLLLCVSFTGTEHTVEVYEDQQGSWRLTKSGSPGKLGPFEEELFQFSEMVCAL